MRFAKSVGHGHIKYKRSDWRIAREPQCIAMPNQNLTPTSGKAPPPGGKAQGTLVEKLTPAREKLRVIDPTVKIAHPVYETA